MKPAGQPFTLGGVARYGFAGPGRWLAAALLFGLLAGLAIALLFALRWSPVFAEALSKLPENGQIRHGALEWPDANVSLLGANSFLSIAAASPDGVSGSGVDFAIELGRDTWSIRSFLGSLELPYPRGWIVPLNRTVLWPLWGAWEKALPPLILLGTALTLILAWSVAAVPYAFVTRFFALVLGKDLSFSQAWKLSVAAQWPGAVLLTFTLALYTLGEAALVLLAATFTAHFCVTLFYLCFAPVALPRRAQNPFTTEPPGAGRSKKKKNPFQSSAGRN